MAFARTGTLGGDFRQKPEFSSCRRPSSVLSRARADDRCHRRDSRRRKPINDRNRRIARPPRQAPYIRRTTLQPHRRAPYPDAVQSPGHFRPPRELSADPRRGPRPGAWPPSYSHPCRYRRGGRPRSPHSRRGPWRFRTSPRRERWRHHQATTAGSDAARHRRKARRTRPIRLRTRACPVGRGPMAAQPNLSLPDTRW